ncbi:MAG TPA: alpha/beta fold hydrolase [Flavitalea sp.]|nr:alpha/beta fold hydrolase [Flavitalea sp.]
MKKMLQFFLFIVCLSAHNNLMSQSGKQSQKPVIVTELQLLDSARNRQVPTVLYSLKAPQNLKSADLVIFSPGNGVAIDYKSYGYLTNHLATKGYLVASIQHMLPTDISGQTSDEFTVTRSPNWETGVTNINYIIERLPLLYPHLKIKSVTLIGHSNGGDIAMLFASQHPEKLAKVISLDNRRIPVPVLKRPIICSIRSSDEAAHEDLLPSKEVIVENNMRVIYLKGIKHKDMDQTGTSAQHEQILKAVDACMSQRWRYGGKNGFNTVTDDL